ncbi:uncharacterized protein LOC128241318 [Mya arenaria]|uniref:uncharacterized protein LOC128241318 n=1 Tax=Mya arenaria TaxID=6604 RepID=UPI0022E562CA|nr:uncharacterized protein LOC128241318 [Mya arenaria]
MLTFNMSSNKVQCDMCCKEQAVGYCNTCGNIGETCVGIHNTGKIFQTHILNIYVNDENNRMHIMFDITGEKCKHHLTENTSLYCRVHGVMICGQCFRLDHCSCGHEVVDLYQEAGRFDKDQYNAMFATLNEIQSEAQRVKEEVDSKKERSNNRAVECNKELDDFENKLKRKVEDSISSFRQEVSNLNDEIIEACSCISSICEEKVAWAIKEKSQLNEIVKNSFSGRFYLMNQNFEKEISEVKRQIKEVEYKRTVRLFHLTENTTAFKCFIEDLKDVCQLQEEVVGSDEGNTYTMGKATQENQETRKDLMEALIISKATRKDLMEALIISKLDVNTAEAARLKAEEELKRTEEDLAYFIQARLKAEEELKRTEEDLAYFKRISRSKILAMLETLILPTGRNVAGELKLWKGYLDTSKKKEESLS